MDKEQIKEILFKSLYDVTIQQEDKWTRYDVATAILRFALKAGIIIGNERWDYQIFSADIPSGLSFAAPFNKRIEIYLTYFDFSMPSNEELMEVLKDELSTIYTYCNKSTLVKTGTAILLLVSDLGVLDRKSSLFNELVEALHRDCYSLMTENARKGIDRVYEYNSFNKPE